MWRGAPVKHAPPEMTEYLLLRELPGYTRELLLAEDAAWVEHMLVIINERYEEEARLRREADNPVKRRR